MVNTKRTAECLKQCTISWAVIGCPSGSGLVYEHSNWSVWLARWTASDKVFDMCVPLQSAEGRAPGAVALASMHCQLGQPVQAEHLWIA
eukprot:scaffold223_cov396-Pavlova_lutheri.AAC.3